MANPPTPPATRDGHCKAVGSRLAVTVLATGLRLWLSCCSVLYMTKRLRPFFTFYGAKWRAAPLYPTPNHDRIVEPFAGAAGYSMLHADRQVTLVDLDPNIVATWRYLITASEEEVLRLPDLKPGQRVSDLTHLDSGAQCLIGWWLNHGAAAPCQTPSAWMRAGTHASSFWGPAINGIDFQRLGVWCKSLPGQVIVCENDGADWLPFRDLASVKSTEGRHKPARFSREVVWTNA